MQPHRAVLAAVLVLALVAACGHDGAVAGTYELDAAAFREAMLATVPAETKADGAQMQRIDEALQQSRVTIMLAPDGGATIVLRGAAGASTETGTWVVDGDALVLTTRDEASKHTIRRARHAGGTLLLDDEMVPGKPVRMTFTKR